MFREIDPEKIVETVARLHDRIRERFPAASLGDIAADLRRIAKDNVARSAAIRRPDYRLRAISFLLLAGAAAAAVWACRSLHLEAEPHWTVSVLAQTLESSLGAVFFLGAAAVFVLTLELRSKRRRCLLAIHEMRAMAHIVDLHQLTKDPDRVLHPAPITPSSPESTMSRAELVRYLDYCSEMLSLIGKVAALYVQGFPDAQAMAAVDDVEELTTSLARKIWQKIMILEQAPPARATAPAASQATASP
jgi:hypothetical protein